MKFEQTLEGQKSIKNTEKVTSVEISERGVEDRLEERECSCQISFIAIFKIFKKSFSNNIHNFAVFPHISFNLPSLFFSSFFLSNIYHLAINYMIPQWYLSMFLLEKTWHTLPGIEHVFYIYLLNEQIKVHLQKYMHILDIFNFYYHLVSKSSAC